MSADYTLWKPKTKEKLKLWTGYWNEILDMPDCKLMKLTASKDHISKKLKEFGYRDPELLLKEIMDFCDDEVVLTNDCGEEWFDEIDVYNGIKDTYKEVGEYFK